VTFRAVGTPRLLARPGQRHALAQDHLPEESRRTWIAGPRVGQVHQPLPDISRVCGIQGLDFTHAFARAVKADLR